MNLKSLFKTLRERLYGVLLAVLVSPLASLAGHLKIAAMAAWERAMETLRNVLRRSYIAYVAFLTFVGIPWVTVWTIWQLLKRAWDIRDDLGLATFSLSYWRTNVRA